MDPEPLVRRAQAGDVRAFEALLERRLGSLLRLALAIIGDEVEARDAVQLACINAWRGLPRLRDTARFDPWLNRILTNECRVALRSRRRRRVREIPASSLDPQRSSQLGSASVAGPAERAEQLEALERAFETLDVEPRTLLVLHHLEGRSVAEIAAELELSPSTVKWRLHQARTALERALEQERR